MTKVCSGNRKIFFHKHWDKILLQMEIEEYVDYKVVNERSANVCLVAVCDALLLHLADIEWTVNRYCL